MKTTKLTHEDTENLNRSILSKEVEFILKKPPRKEHKGLKGFPREFSQMFREELRSILHSLFLEGEEGYFPTYSTRSVLP